MSVVHESKGVVEVRQSVPLAHGDAAVVDIHSNVGNKLFLQLRVLVYDVPQTAVTRLHT